MKDNTKDIEKNISELNNTIEELTNSIGPLMDFRNIEKQIELLKDIVPTAENIKNSEGETCMHGNSWNSECSECSELNLIDNIFLLVKQYPDDADLGKAFRELYNSYSGDSDKTEE